MHANLAAGIRVATGTYHVNGDVPDQSHIYMRCGDDRDDDFEVDFTGVFFYFTVRSPLSAPCCMHPYSYCFLTSRHWVLLVESLALEREPQ